MIAKINHCHFTNYLISTAENIRTAIEETEALQYQNNDNGYESKICQIKLFSAIGKLEACVDFAKMIDFSVDMKPKEEAK